MTQPKNRRIATEDYFDKATADFPRTVPVINKGQITTLAPGSTPTFAVRRIGTTNVYEVDMGIPGIPARPATGNYKLVSRGGTVSWVLE